MLEVASWLSSYVQVSQDGMLRVLHWDTMELVGSARSYFGGLLCVCWSPDGKYIVCGGEDDLVTVYSFHERRVVVRGQGHRSWVSVVSFDVQNLAYGEVPDGLDFSGSDDECAGVAPGAEEVGAHGPPGDWGGRLRRLRSRWKVRVGATLRRSGPGLCRLCRGVQWCAGRLPNQGALQLLPQFGTLDR